MSQPTQQLPQDMSNLMHRMKARLALANFKREHGFENIDLRTLESSLYEDKLKPLQQVAKVTTISSPLLDKKRKKLMSHHRFYPTSPPMQHNDMDRLIKKNASRSPANIPLSETRLQHPYKRHYYSTTPNAVNTTTSRKLSATLSSDDEDAAHLLVLMHQSPTMSS
ncbi:uncharacterized protein BX663DRAFT_527415 [Cokeromyces recurvatus]|uniref:uncharacterized protein n=1 Tax=Cokeromyces recurvatus TaxID=90255 RepID=UPI00221E55AE|nr:uncharacterized protein BX663DRAFT_527415 [Cokeromyces recurvatus]KAI7897748.1 hypothetical protein BX663DRAFT_527415 [Cokeromyces recurvatus]